MLEVIQNLVKVTGNVKYIEKLAKSVRVTVRVMRPKQELRYYRDRTTFDDIWFYFFPEDNNNLSEIMLGDVVTVSGHVTAPRKVRPDGTWYWSQAFIGDYIALCPDQNSTQPGHGYVFLSGPVENMVKLSKGGVKLRMNAIQNGHNNHIWISMKGTDANRFKEGDIIDVSAYIITRKHVSEAGRISYRYDIRTRSVRLHQRDSVMQSQKEQKPDFKDPEGADNHA